MNAKRSLSALLALIILLTTCVMGVSAAEEKLPFTDVPENEWYYGAVEFVYENGLMNGTGNGSTFSPMAKLTRGMVVTVLYRNNYSPAVANDEIFVDVAKGQYYAKASAWAYENGIVTGTGFDDWGEPIFSPDRNITRQELAAIFGRYASFKNVDVDKNTADITKFPDSGKVASWAEKEFKWASGNGIINGKTSGGESYLAPTDTATRAEFATIIERFNSAEFEYVLKYATPDYNRYRENKMELVTDADIYVAVDGDDRNDGSLEKPLASFEAARDKVRELNDGTRNGITVAFKAGDYGALNINFTEEDAGTADCPITYCAYGDGKVTFNNGMAIASGEFKPLDEADKKLFGESYVNDIKKVYIGDRLGDNVDISSVYLFSADGFCNFARFPNKGTVDTFLSNFFEKAGDSSIKVLVSKEKFDNYHTFDGVQIVGHFMYEWATANAGVVSYDKEIGVFQLSGTSGYGISEDKADIKLYINNVSEELDFEKEFWIDRNTGMLYVYKPAGNYSLATYGTFVNMLHSDYVTFENLDFTTTTAKAMHIYADNVTLRNCDISYVAGDIMIRFDNAGVSNCVVEGCNFSYLAGSGIRIDGTSPELVNDGNKFINNGFDNYCIVYTSGNGLHINHCMGTLVANNVFSNSPRTGLDVYGCIDCVIEYNVFDNVMTNSADGGALYFGGTRWGRANIVRYNLFTNIKVGAGIFTIYLDDGTSGQILYSNIFYNSGDYSIMISGGRDNQLYDNITIVEDGNRKGFWTHDKYYNMWHDGELDPGRWNEIADDYVRMQNESDPVKLNFYKTRFPEVFTMILTFEDYKDSNCMINPKNYYSKNYVFGSTHVYRQSALDCSTIIENKDDISLDTNDYFVNPSIGDYSIKDGADFADNHFDKIGRIAP
ncbi:MAG: S-layer homology domain-containing protein [Clostridia bacterium]|nr:S-layer homology domain-containing protein [Clostridia bacterium]